MTTVMHALTTLTARGAIDLSGQQPIRLDLGKADLPAIFRSCGFTRGAEIGVWKGGLSEAFCKGMPDLEMFCVDPWAPYAEYRESKNHPVLIEAAYQEALVRLKPYRCTFLRMTSAQALPFVEDRSLDFVYLDGNHERSFVLADLEGWTEKVRHGGVIAGHDYRDAPEKPYIQVKPAVDEYVALHGIAPWFLLTADRTPSFLWVVA